MVQEVNTNTLIHFNSCLKENSDLALKYFFLAINRLQVLGSYMGQDHVHQYENSTSVIDYKKLVNNVTNTSYRILFQTFNQFKIDDLSVLTLIYT
jgi:hypothetical protein